MTEAQNDIGFGTIVGSAVFNVLFVVGLFRPQTFTAQKPKSRKP